MSSYLKAKKGFLVLKDGTVFEGDSFGYEGTTIGEVVFNTGITGYQEVITDPSYFGQLITFTYPEIGNTGINFSDSESHQPLVKGVIVRNFTSKPSNWRSDLPFDYWLKENKIIAISGVDTRALVKCLRSKGSMNGILTTEENVSLNECFEKLLKTPSMDGQNLAREVSTKCIYHYKDNYIDQFDINQKKINKELKVVALDFGIKKSILNHLTNRGCKVEVVPYNTSYQKILDLKPDGLFLSNGPGDPAAVYEAIETVKSFLDFQNIPIFGICLGHQILGIALGGKTFKLHYGHRGLNHPCGINNKVEITSQNHGFAIDKNSLPSDLINITHFNLNDKTVAGLEVINKSVFSVQYHPEAGPGPHDSKYLFDKFIGLMLEKC
tara:strand:+ start:5096 stop:6238 length:1143 start_codon:yes stop_codon:yes gene_type:complete